MSRYSSIQEMIAVKRNKAKEYTLPVGEDGQRVRLVAAEVWRVSVPIKNERGQNVWRMIEFEPDTWYQVNDAALLNVLKGKSKVKKAYSKELESQLKDKGIPHEVVKCKTCGGKVTKIEYSILEFEEGK